jgi:hypothetical protein
MFSVPSWFVIVNASVDGLWWRSCSRSLPIAHLRKPISRERGGRSRAMKMAAE